MARVWGQLFIQQNPPSGAPCIVGSLWVDKTNNVLKRCTSVNPYTFVSVEGGGGGGGLLYYLNQQNRSMLANITVNDGDKATDTTVQANPASGSYIEVFVNGVKIDVGDGDASKECFIGVGDTDTPRYLSDVTSGDTLRWNGSIARYQLDQKDRIDFSYVVST